MAVLGFIGMGNMGSAMLSGAKETFGKENIISIVLVLMNHNRYPFLSLFFKFFLIRQMTAALKPLPACHTYSLHLQISLICCVRKSDFLLYKKSCMLTDRMSGISVAELEIHIFFSYA